MTDLPPINLNLGNDDPNTDVRDELLQMTLDAIREGDITIELMDTADLTAAILGLVQTLVTIHGVEFAQMADMWSDVFASVLATTPNTDA